MGHVTVLHNDKLVMVFVAKGALGILCARDGRTFWPHPYATPSHAAAAVDTPPQIKFRISGTTQRFLLRLHQQTTANARFIRSRD